MDIAKQSYTQWKPSGLFKINIQTVLWIGLQYDVLSAVKFLTLTVLMLLTWECK